MQAAPCYNQTTGWVLLFDLVNSVQVGALTHGDSKHIPWKTSCFVYAQRRAGHRVKFKYHFALLANN
jgi:hypothetical protein